MGVAVGEAGDPFGCGGERDAVAGLAGPDSDPDREVGFAGAGRSEEHDVGPFCDEGETRPRHPRGRQRVKGCADRACRSDSLPWARRAVGACCRVPAAVIGRTHRARPHSFLAEQPVRNRGLARTGRSEQHTGPGGLEHPCDLFEALAGDRTRDDDVDPEHAVAEFVQDLDVREIALRHEHDRAQPHCPTTSRSRARPGSRSVDQREP